MTGVIYLGEPTGPRLRSLSLAKTRELDAWLTNAMSYGASKHDKDLPVDYTRALSTLAQRRGIRFHFNGDRMRVPGEVPLGSNIPGCVGGSKRKITVTDERAIASKHGQAVEPWNMRDWRE
ncbi:hypothetical protein AVU99_gp043 [Mycobacterium phage Lolly9]|uniref:Uncharacterized protein n=1 Tax=Mycobacterium phage Lolly9 TaxID=1698711 RepID=A0A0K2FMY0_9CAUD|nr:hypothetical protein AVU99_gp043 [Mycobacterium phage Lolly9]ALA48461.1 hypothetical protein LOLLY9_43 [Mycobacterium phage Lolly9]QOP65772.1 hypothetical protein PBI_MINILON_44 [Mycobacterium phage MiniLon]QOP66518.1 hypothetical protein PBI_MINIMAC_44 [Mycobacterium phage MiniMac]